MKNNLTARTVVIVVTMLICVFGIIGIPKSGADLKKNFEDNIRLGLDLKGGTHLVLEIQVQDAVKADAEQTAHMFFAPGVQRFPRTHPSLVDRIRELDPQFNAKQLPALAASALKSVPRPGPRSTRSVTPTTSAMP